MNSICKDCVLAGNVAESLSKQGWVGCRKVLQLLQQTINHPNSRYKNTEDISCEIVQNIKCDEAATGWVDNGPLGKPSGRIFNGILMTKGTSICLYFEKES